MSAPPTATAATAGQPQVHAWVSDFSPPLLDVPIVWAKRAHPVPDAASATPAGAAAQPEAAAAGAGEEAEADDVRCPSDALEVMSRLLRAYAWYHRGPSVLSEVRAKLLSGQLQAGHPEWNQKHVRPVAYYGRTCYPRFARRDKFVGAHTEGDDDGYNSGFGLSASELAFDCFAFDIVDGAGREYPLVIEYRGDANPDAPAYCGHGVLLDRTTLNVIGALASSDEDVSSLTLRPAAVDVFRRWTPHGAEEMLRALGEDTWEAYGEIRPDGKSTKWAKAWEEARTKAATEPTPAAEEAAAAAAGSEGASSSSVVSSSESAAGSSSSPMVAGAVVHPELQNLICAGAKLVRWAWSTQDATMFTAFHPPELVHSFTLGVLQQALEATPAAQALHRDVLGVIAEYAPIDLPFIQMDSKDRVPQVQATKDEDVDDGIIYVEDDEDIPMKFLDDDGRTIDFFQLCKGTEW